MPAVADVQRTRVANLGPGIIEQPRGLGEGSQDIQLCQGGSAPLEGGESFQDGLAHAQKEFVFEFDAAFLGAQDFAFHVLQLGRDEAFTVGDGLLAGVMRRDFVEVGLGDLEVIAEDGIESDLERVGSDLFCR